MQEMQTPTDLPSPPPPLPVTSWHADSHSYFSLAFKKCGHTLTARPSVRCLLVPLGAGLCLALFVSTSKGF